MTWPADPQAPPQLAAYGEWRVTPVPAPTRLTEAIEAEWFNGNMDEGTRDRLLSACAFPTTRGVELTDLERDGLIRAGDELAAGGADHG